MVYTTAQPCVFFYFFMNNTASIVLNACLNTKLISRKYSPSTSGNPRNFTTYIKTVNVLLKQDAINKEISETELVIYFFAQSLSIKPSQYVEKLVTKTLHCGDVYEEYAIMAIFIEETMPFIHQPCIEGPRRAYWLIRRAPRLHQYNQWNVHHLDRRRRTHCSYRSRASTPYIQWKIPHSVKYAWSTIIRNPNVPFPQKISEKQLLGLLR